MSGYDCRNKWLFSFWRNVVSDGADWTSTGRLFQSRGPAAANERSPTVTSRDGRMSRRLEVDERFIQDGKLATYWSWPDRYWGAVPWRARYTRTASLNLMRSGARSQWKLARASVICSERLCHLSPEVPPLEQVEKENQGGTSRGWCSDVVKGAGVGRWYSKPPGSRTDVEQLPDGDCFWWSGNVGCCWPLVWLLWSIHGSRWSLGRSCYSQTAGNKFYSVSYTVNRDMFAL